MPLTLRYLSLHSITFTLCHALPHGVFSWLGHHGDSLINLKTSLSILVIILIDFKQVIMFTVFRLVKRFVRLFFCVFILREVFRVVRLFFCVFILEVTNYLKSFMFIFGLAHRSLILREELRVLVCTLKRIHFILRRFHIFFWFFIWLLFWLIVWVRAGTDITTFLLLVSIKGIFRHC